ncbi:cysteine desulfurase DndA [Aeromonas allosaccharophila]|nr:cysteine desulfurase DndA [Aeromonas allosaccharophila]
MAVYLDCNATTPVSSGVAEVVMRYMTEEYGNSGSRTHEFGVVAKQAVERARGLVAAVVGADKSDVYFTSGATESNNLAILGLAQYAEQQGRKHIITTPIEHKAVLEPIAQLEAKGFEVTYLPMDSSGMVDPAHLRDALRPDTVLVSIMHINNETGSIQPISELCEVLTSHDAFFHVDAAQSYGKYSEVLEDPRIDMISVSGHKMYAPKGVGALLLKRRNFKRAPLTPLMFGGGQERGLRPGTLPVALIAGLGQACEEAKRDSEQRRRYCEQIKEQLRSALRPLGCIENGQNTASHVLNVSIPGVNSEAALVVLKGIVALSNGSACTSQSYVPSHVLMAMGLDEERIEGAIRISWCHMTKDIPLEELVDRIKKLQ